MKKGLRLRLKVLSLEHPSLYNFLRTAFYLGLSLLLCLVLESPIRHLSGLLASGNSASYRRIGDLLQSENPVERNIALRLLEEKAAESEDQARWMLAKGWHDGDFGEKNLFLAKKWLLEIQGEKTAQANELLAAVEEKMRRNDFTLRELQNEAARCDRAWLRRGGAALSSPEELAFAMMELNCGAGLRNIQDALERLEKLADAKNPIACYLLGRLFGEGRQVKPDLALSASYLQEACAGNVDEACAMLSAQRKEYGNNYGKPHVGRSLREIREELEMLAK